MSFIHSPLQSFIDSRSEGRRWGRKINRLGKPARNPQLDVIQLARAENVSYPINGLVRLYYGMKFFLLHCLFKDKKRLFIVPNEDEVVYPVISSFCHYLSSFLPSPCEAFADCLCSGTMCGLSFFPLQLDPLPLLSILLKSSFIPDNCDCSHLTNKSTKANNKTQASLYVDRILFSPRGKKEHEKRDEFFLFGQEVKD